LTALLFCETLKRVAAAEERLEAIEGKLDIVIRRFELNQQLTDGFDDRVAKLETIAKKQAETAKMLADAAMRLSIARVASVPSLRILTMLIIAAVAGGVSGGVAVAAGRNQSNQSANSSALTPKQPSNLPPQ
jgi:hypothetical protein